MNGTEPNGGGSDRSGIVSRLVLVPLGGALLAIPLLFASPQNVGAGEALIESGDLAQTLSVEELRLDGDRVTGLLVNRTDKTARDVRLQVVFSWLWRDEKHPGNNDPSFVVTEIPTGEVAPHGTMPFAYTYPSVITSRADGEFMLDARVLGYSAVKRTTEMPMMPPR
jgi:hypothetical protein